MHRRLNVSLERLKRIMHSGGDKAATLSGTAHANAIDANQQYMPSYVGKTVHMDLVGQLSASHICGYKYVLILVDDHSQFKVTYMIKERSDALDTARNFIATVRSVLATVMHAPIPNTILVGSQCGGGSQTRAFKEELAREGITLTTPPSGTAERSDMVGSNITSVLGLARFNLLASNLPTSFWG